jgi:heme/copper-type cytochrome/quinol oxidase subunit 3
MTNLTSQPSTTAIEGCVVGFVFDSIFVGVQMNFFKQVYLNPLEHLRSIIRRRFFTIVG